VLDFTGYSVSAVATAQSAFMTSLMSYQHIRGIYQSSQPSPLDSISGLTSNTLSHQFLSVTHHGMYFNLTFSTVGILLDVYPRIRLDLS
jgi:hypothetical protein